MVRNSTPDIGRWHGRNGESFLIRTPSSALPPLSLRTRLARGVAWNLVGVVFNQGSTFLVNLILAHMLGLVVFGEYAMVQSTVAVATMLAQIATGYTATKYVAEFRTTDPVRAGRLLGLLGVAALSMATLTGAMLLVASGFLADSFLHEANLAPALAIASAGVFFSAVSGFLMGALAGLESYRTLGLAGITSGLIYVLTGVTGAHIGGLNGAVAGVAISGLLQCGVLWQCVLREARRNGIPVGLAGAWTEAEIILRFAIPAALNGFIAMPAVWLSNAFLAGQEGGYALLALFTAANSFRIIVLFLPNIVNSVSMSLLNHQKGLNDERRYRRVFWVNLAATLGTVLAGAAFVAVTGRWLLLWFGPAFTAGYTALLLLMAVTIPESASTALFQIIQSRERIWWSVGAVAIPCYGTLVAVAWWLTPSYGAVGLAWAHLAAWIVALSANCVIVSRLGVHLPGTSRVPTRA